MSNLLYAEEDRVNMPSSELDIQRRSRYLRNNLTDAEALLWSRIRRRQLAGLLFYRQKAIGAYIADFYCHEAKLVVEVDGAEHRTKFGMKQDRVRDEYMSSVGISVLRFSKEILENVEGVLQMIKEKLGNQ